MTLVELSIEWQQAFETFALDFKQHDPENYPTYQLGHANFSEYLDQIRNQQTESYGREPMNYYWLVDERKNSEDKADENKKFIVGAIVIRHYLKRKIIKEEVGHVGYDIAPAYRNQGYGT